MADLKSLPASLITALVAEFGGDVVHAMLLTGSYVRETATQFSDVDLVRFVDETPERTVDQYLLRYRDGRLISISTATVEAKRAELRRPERAIVAVEGLRRARPLVDRDGRLAALLAEAAAFEWAPLQDAADAYARELMMGLAEEVHKALSGLARGDEGTMLYATLGLVSGLASALIVQRGVLLVSENDYLDAVQRAAGRTSAWTRLYRGLTGFDAAPVGPEPARARTAAALRLYMETVRLLQPVLVGEDGAVAARAVATALAAGVLGDK